MRLAVIADTVRAYFDVTTSAERVKVARKPLLLDRSIRITGARVDVGRSDRLDLIRVTALRDQQAATIPSLKADREAALLRLATLTGRAPQGCPPMSAPGPKRRISRSRSRSAMARPCSPGGPMCARPNGGWPPTPRGSALPSRIFIRAFRWADRAGSVRSEPWMCLARALRAGRSGRSSAGLSPIRPLCGRGSCGQG
jgi:hypothetical protein